MKNITLIKIDTDAGLKKHLPLSLLYLGTALKTAGFAPKLVHCSENDSQNIAKQIIKNKPLFVGFSVLTGPQIKHAANLSRSIKKQSNIPVLWGGVHPSILPKQCIEEDYIDYVLMGEGEESIVLLAETLYKKKSLKGLKGLLYKENGTIFDNGKRDPIMDLGKIRIDYNLIDTEKYVRKMGKIKRALDYTSSRGCPFSCAFCYNASFSKRKWRPFPIENVLKDIQYLKDNYKLDGISFNDDNFFVNKKRAVNILKEIDIATYTHIRIDAIEEEYLQELKQLKCTYLLIGVESGNDETLKSVHKGFTVEEIKNKVIMLNNYNIGAWYSLIIGLPGESRESMYDTIDLVLWIRKHHKNSKFFIGQYAPYPGTKSYEAIKNLGFCPPEHTEGWSLADRWSPYLGLPLPGVDQKLCHYIRWYSFCFHPNNALLNAIAEFRLKYKIFILPIDLKIIMFVFNRILCSKNRMLLWLIGLFKRS